jgi:predicted nucleic acid-binding protein
MPSYDPELITTMRAALDEVMTHVPVEQATLSIKVRLAEFILKAAAEGQTSYDALYAAAAEQIQTVISMLT